MPAIDKSNLVGIYMHIGVTGSSGFIGQAFLRTLREKKICFSRITRGSGSTCSRNVSCPVFKCEHVDVVVHLAGKAHRRESLDESVRASIGAAYKAANCDYAVEVARSSFDKGMRRFVFVSSISVYGVNSSTIALSENNVVDPKNPYAQSKLDAEVELRQLSEDLGFELIILRPPLVYGTKAPGNFGTLLQFIGFTRLVPFGTRKNKRSLIYVDNLVDLLLFVAQNERVPPDTYNVADYESVSTYEIVKHVATGMDKKLVILNLPKVIWRYLLNIFRRNTVYKQLFEDLEVSTVRLRKKLNWHPPFTISEGLVKSGQKWSSNS